MERAHDCIDAMAKMAEAKGVTIAQIALAWLLHQEVVTTVIVGAKRIEQLDDNIAATNVKLNDDELAALDEVSQLASEYPGWMLARTGEYRLNQLKESNG
jgi:aryl-alcohol dehydrogenase-like predicted oxidoreductase